MGGFSGLAADVIESGAKALSKTSMPALQKAGADIIESGTKFFTEHSNLETALARGKTGPVLKQLITEHQNETGKATAQILNNIHIDPGKAKSLASTQVADNMFGKNREVLAYHVDKYRKEHTQEAAQSLVDHLGLYFGETPYSLKGGGGDISKLTQGLRTSPYTKDVRWDVSPLEPRHGAEKLLEKTQVTGLMAQKAGMLHALSGPLNLTMDSSLKSSWDVFSGHFTGDRAGVISKLKAINGISELTMETQRQALAYENGLLKNAPPMFRYLYGNIIIPGMSFAKKWNIKNFAIQGYYDAQYITKDLLSGRTDKDLFGLGLSKVERAKRQAELYGMDWREILNTGKLSDDNIANAALTNVRRKLMTETGTLRTRYSQTTPVGRVTSLFHGYATGQRNFLMQAFTRHIKNRDPLAFGRDLAILTMAFPDIGASVRYLNDIWTGKDESEARDKMLKTWKSSVTPDGYTTAEAWTDRMDAMLHLTGFGVVSSYYRAAARHQLSKELLGPVVGEAVKGIEDLTTALGGGSTTPLAKDVLRRIVPIAGPIAAGKLFSTESGSSGRPKRPRAPTRPTYKR